MPERKTSFMPSLDEWTAVAIIRPLFEAAEAFFRFPEDSTVDQAMRRVDAEVKKAIRAKVLESYRNGQAAGPSRKFPIRK